MENERVFRITRNGKSFDKIYPQNKIGPLRSNLTGIVKGWYGDPDPYENDDKTRLEGYEVVEYELVPVTKISAHKFRIKKEYEKWKFKKMKLKYIIETAAAKKEKLNE